jgi:hypothetical protein
MPIHQRHSDETRAMLATLEERLADTLSERRAITNQAKRAGRSTFDEIETAHFHEISATVEVLRQAITELREKSDGLAALENAAARIGKGGNGASDSETIGRAWATNAVNALHKMGGEQRAVISGSVDVPILLDQPVVNIPFPKRLIDVVGARRSVDSMSWSITAR